MSENAIILTESEIRDALNKYFIPDIYYEDESKHEVTLYRKTIDDVIDALVLYSSPARINRQDTKSLTSSFMVTEKSGRYASLKFIKEQLVYDLIDKLVDEAIILKHTNDELGFTKYEIDLIFRFKDEKPGMEVVDDYDPDERIGDV